MSALSKWQDVKLGDVLTLKRGYDLPQRERRAGEVPIVSSSGVTDFHNTAKVAGPGVVTGRYGTLGEIFYVENDYWPLNTSLYVQDFKGNYPRFISYFLRTLNFATQNVAGAVPGVNRNVLHMMPVKVPPLETQRQIAAILSVYDDLIENNQRRIKVLGEMAGLIYREWFVNFRFPGHEGVRMVASELGEIPEGWNLVLVKELVASNIGGDWGSETATSKETEAVLVIRGTDITDVQSGQENRAPTRFISMSSYEKRKIQPFDVIIENSINASSRSVGTSLLVTEGMLRRAKKEVIPASFCKLYRPKRPGFGTLIHQHLRYLRQEGLMGRHQNVATNGIANFQSKRFLDECLSASRPSFR